MSNLQRAIPVLIRHAAPQVLLLVGVSTAVVAAAQRPQVATCAVTAAVEAEGPADPGADFSGRAPWFISADRSIRAGADGGRWRAGEQGNKVMWIRPQGASLSVSGRRIDVEGAAPLRAHLPCCYRTGFQASRLYFPSPGCWEITARSGRSELRFVARVS
ncbi:MAG TPA: hypothetical protein VM032_11365 [Vicinamibacterales bacterium]|nr:hypothetical protein [Vicinamibacterales bacterium]